MRPALRVLAGITFGVVLAFAAHFAVSLTPTRLPVPTERNLSIPSVRGVDGVSLSFVTTGTARPPGRRLHHGAGLGRHDIAFRAALVQHPRGNVLFGTGVDPDGPSGLVFDPFGKVTARELPELPEIARVVLPTPRWYHMGGLERWAALADAQVFAGSGDLWQARSGPWPRRYAMEPGRVTALGDRARSVPWARRRWYGTSRAWDMYGDGSIVLIALRGSTIDEVAAVVTVDSGARFLLVGDAVWTSDQVTERFPRAPWSTWLLDRNRMQLAATQTLLLELQRDHAVVVVPLLDGAITLPEYPDAAR